VKVAIDYTTAIWPGAGVARYTAQLVAALAEADPANQYTLLYGGSSALPHDTEAWAAAQRLFTTHPNFQPCPIPGPLKLALSWQRFAPRLLPAEVFTGRVDIFHAPDFVAPATRARLIITIHDLSFLVMPECAEEGLRRYLTATLPRSARRADLILADSEATRRDIIAHLGIAEARVRVVYGGVDARFRPVALNETERAMLLQRVGLPNAPFVLAVSRLEPRKNFVRLIEAFGQLVAAGYPHNLAISGRKGWLYEPIFAAAERVNTQYGQRVFFLDHVLDADLPALYSSCAAFAYPSLYEGFGLPPLEAMACAAPVLVSNASSLPEVVGDAAVMVSPTDTAAIADGLRRILDDAQLAANLRQRGPQQAARFTWAAAAREVLAAYRDVLKSGS
jgi:glycosyltransferase involved in cell wall biosynthesis